jgi:hypothetical protein
MVSQKMNPEVLAAATSMLRISYPDITPSSLVAALEKENAATKPATPIGKMFTLKEVCGIAHISMPTLLRITKRNELKTVLVGKRSRRVPAAVLESYLNGGER